MLSNNACEEVAIPGALPVQAAETGHCWKAPYWELPGASVIRNRNRKHILKAGFYIEDNFCLNHKN